MGIAKSSCTCYFKYIFFIISHLFKFTACSYDPACRNVSPGGTDISVRSYGGFHPACRDEILLLELRNMYISVTQPEASEPGGHWGQVPLHFLYLGKKCPFLGMKVPCFHRIEVPFLQNLSALFGQCPLTFEMLPRPLHATQLFNDFGVFLYLFARKSIALARYLTLLYSTNIKLSKTC